MDRVREALVGASENFKHRYSVTARVYGEAEVQKLQSKGTENNDMDEDELKRSQYYQELYQYFHAFVFPNIPEHYPLKKKLVLAKASTTFGNFWDIFGIMLSLLACAMYVAGLSYIDIYSVKVINVIEIIITQFFLIDFLFNWFTAHTSFAFFLNPMTAVDLLTILPVYIKLAIGRTKGFSTFRFLRILRLARILRAFRLLKGLTGVQRQLITLILTVLSLIFLASGIVQIFENDVYASLYLKCWYISEDTNWQPSCDMGQPTYNSTDCDCQAFNCDAAYSDEDANGQPSLVTCQIRSFFVCFYYIIVTMATVGYGDFYPTSDYSRIVTIVFIVATMVLVPVQLNNLGTLLAQKSAFRDPYVPSMDSQHIIICGDVENRNKIEPFFKEFFHPDRTSAADIRALIMSLVEPNDDIRSFLLSPVLEGKLFFMIGSPLSVSDLVRARADLATAIFILTNAECSNQTAEIADSSTITSLLSVCNFNPKLECFAQVVRSGCRDALKESSVDLIVCLDDLRTILMARNVLCRGIATMIELLFMSFGSTEKEEPWYQEYLHGAGLEIYLIPISFEYFDAVDYLWTIAVEGIFLKYNVLLIGVCNLRDQKICLNPDFKDIGAFESPSAFFDYYNVGIVIADEQLMASTVASGTADESTVNEILTEVLKYEQQVFSCRVSMAQSGKRERRKDLAPIITRRTSANIRSNYVKEEDDSDTGKPRESRANQNFRMHAGLKDHQNIALNLSESNPIDNLKTMTLGGLLDICETYQSSLKTAYETVTSDSSSSDDDDLPEFKEETFTGLVQVSENDIEKKSGEVSRAVSVTSKVAKKTMVKREREDVGGLEDHIIVFGCVDNLVEFISEFRRPCITDFRLHPIVVVDEEVPPKWDYIAKKFREVYLIRGSIMKSSVYNRTNVKYAYALVSLSKRNNVDISEDENRDSDTLFSFLKLEPHVPSSVFFCVELIVPQNLSVLNSTVVKQAKKTFELKNYIENMDVHYTKTRKSRAQFMKEFSQYLPKDTTHNIVGTFMQKKTKKSELIEVHDNTASVKKKKKKKKQDDDIDEVSARKMRSAHSDGTSGNKNKSGPSFWDATNTHHMLPVFASGIAFTPATFDTLPIQSFYNTLIPAICDALICGQGHKTVHFMRVPNNFVGFEYSAVFRAFNSRNLLCLGVYRSASYEQDKSILPYVYTSPEPNTIMRENDFLYIFGNPFILKKCTTSFDLALIPANDEETRWILPHLSIV